MAQETIKFKERKTDLKYKGKPVYEITKVIQKDGWIHKQATIADLCEKYVNKKGEECYRKIYY